MKWMSLAFLCLTVLLNGCGKDKVTELTNDQKLPGNWLLTDTNGGAIAKIAEKDSVVLTFKDSKAAISAVDSFKGAVSKLIPDCRKGPRPYKTDGTFVVFEAVTGCPEIRLNIDTLNSTNLQLPNPDKADVKEVFTKISDADYQRLVKPADRRL